MEAVDNGKGKKKKDYWFASQPGLKQELRYPSSLSGSFTNNLDKLGRFI